LSLYGARKLFFGLLTTLHTGRSGVRIPVESRGFSLLQNVKTNSGAYPASYSVGTGVLSRGYGGRVVKFTHFHPLPRLRMSGSVFLLPVYDFVAWSEKTLLYYTLIYSNFVSIYSMLCRSHDISTKTCSSDGSATDVSIFWVLRLNSRVSDFQRFEGKYPLHLQGSSRRTTFLLGFIR